MTRVTRSDRLELRVTHRDVKRWRAAAADRELSLSEWVRDTLNEATRIVGFRIRK